MRARARRRRPRRARDLTRVVARPLSYEDVLHDPARALSDMLERHAPAAARALTRRPGGFKNVTHYTGGAARNAYRTAGPFTRAEYYHHATYLHEYDEDCLNHVGGLLDLELERSLGYDSPPRQAETALSPRGRKRAHRDRPRWHRRVLGRIIGYVENALLMVAGAILLMAPFALIRGQNNAEESAAPEPQGGAM